MQKMPDGTEYEESIEPAQQKPENGILKMLAHEAVVLGDPGEIGGLVSKKYHRSENDQPHPNLAGDRVINQVRFDGTHLGFQYINAK